MLEDQEQIETELIKIVETLIAILDIKESKFRKTVRERDVVCQRCGMTDEESLIEYGSRLDMHHLDGDHENNDPKNGVLLCRYCHGTVARHLAWRPSHRWPGNMKKSTRAKRRREFGVYPWTFVAGRGDQ